MTKTKLQIMREKNEELLRANINMHDAVDLKSERIQELKKQLATAVEALKEIRVGGDEVIIDPVFLFHQSQIIVAKALNELGENDEI